jgi:hypothetical protein
MPSMSLASWERLCDYTVMNEERNCIRIISTAKDARKFVMGEVKCMVANGIAIPTFKK